MPSLAFMESVLDPETPHTHVCLITFTHALLDPPIRVCSGGENIVSLGDEFLAYPFTIALPGDSPDRSTRRARLQIDNVDPVIIATLRSLPSAPMAKMEVALAATPDVIEFDWSNFKLGDPQFDAGVIAADLTPRDDSAEMWPVQRYGPSGYPGLFD